MNIVKQIALGKIYFERDYIKNIWYYNSSNKELILA